MKNCKALAGARSMSVLKVEGNFRLPPSRLRNSILTVMALSPWLTAQFNLEEVLPTASFPTATDRRHELHCLNLRICRLRNRVSSDLLKMTVDWSIHEEFPD